MNLNQLRVFHAAAKLLNFTRAAEELHLTQPGISKHLKDLEEYYRTPLFERAGKKVALTQAGTALYVATTAAFTLFDSAKSCIDDIIGLAGGRLTIGTGVTIGTYILPAKLVSFRQRYPGIEIKVETALSRQTTERVLNNSVELGLVAHYAPDPRLEAQPFMRDRLALVVSPGHPWVRRKTAISLKEFGSQALLVSKRGSGTWRIIETLMAQKGFQPGSIIELGTTEAVKQAVAANLGISLLSRHVLERELTSGTITAIPLTGGEPSRDLYLITHKGRYLTQAARAFVELLFEA